MRGRLGVLLIAMAIGIAYVIGYWQGSIGSISPEPEKAETEKAASTPEATWTVDVNQADHEALLSLPGVGPVLADRILEDRKLNGPYAEYEDLQRVRGIGPVLLRKIMPHLRIESDSLKKR